MVLGIDASRYGGEQATGVEWYSYRLLNELVPMLGRDHGTKVLLYSPRDFELKADVPFNVKKRVMPMKRLWTLVRMSWEMLTKRPDTLFVPSHVLPFFVGGRGERRGRTRAVITIHDVAFKHFKECYSWKDFMFLDWGTRRAVKRAHRIIVPSEATKKDLIGLYKCPARKIVVIPHGAPELPRFLAWKDSEKDKLLKQFHLEERDLFVFYVGRLEAKKNLVRLVKGFARFSSEFPGWKLVLAGKRGVGFDDIDKCVKELNLEQQVLMPGYVSEEEKVFLMSSCRIVALPSLYEGFGLPVLEGFAARRPVLTSNCSSMPEVAGDAALLVDPLKEAEIGVALKRLASDGMLVNRLVQKGEEQLQTFSWEKAAEATYDVLTEDVTAEAA